MIYYISNAKKLFTSSNITQTTLQEAIIYCKTLDIIGVDIETTGKDPYVDRVLSIQLGNYENQYVIDTTTVLLASFKELLEDETKLFIFQNGQFDLRFLYHAGIYPKKIYDTMLVENIITGGYGDKADKQDIKDVSNTKIAEELVDRELSLDKLTNKYCNAQLNKSIRAVIQIEGLTERVIEYGADDVKYLHEIREKQLQIIEYQKNKYGFDGKVVDLENEVVKVIAKMIYDGVTVNAEQYRKDVITGVKKAVNDTIVNLDGIVHKEPELKQYRFYQGDLFSDVRKTGINWNSPAQKLNILRKFYPNIENTAAETIKKEVKHPIGQFLLDYNKNRKLESAFGENLLANINTVSQRIHPSIWQILSTGRISMQKPNLLQMPSKGDLGKKIRNCFVPRKGYKMVGGDYSSFELAIIAEFSQDPLWIDTLNAGKNLHTKLCSETFDIPEDKVNEPFPYNPDMTYRDVQKTIDFGLAYGMSKFKLASTIDVSTDHAQKIIDGFFAKVPMVRKFLDKIGLLGKKRGYIKVPNPYGRVRFFPKYDFIKQHPEKAEPVKQLWLGEVERASKNTPIQGLNGNVIKLALIKAQKSIDTNGYPARILLSIYDELQTECREDMAEEWSVELQRQMLEAAKIFVKTVPVEVDCKVSDYWSK